MGLFDTIVKGVGDYLGSEDGDEMIDNFRGFLSDEGAGDSGEGGGFGGLVSSLFGDAEEGEGEGSGGLGGFVDSFLGDAEEGEDGGAGGWGGTFGRIVDQLSGDGGREDLWDRAVSTVTDRVSQYLPEELREVAGQYMGQGQGQGGQGSSWAGSLVDPNQTQVPNGWQAVANHPTIGHSYGEGGFGGLLDHSIANLSGNHGAPDDGIRYIRAPDIEPGRPLGHDGSPDPRVTMPAEALGGARYVDTDGDGYADRIYPQPGSLPRQVDGDDHGTEPDGFGPDVRSDERGDHDTDGDGYPDRIDPIGSADIEHGGSPGRSAPSSTYDDQADYDDMVTSGAGAPSGGYEQPDDPTFPADDPGMATTDFEPPTTDFAQSIDVADQVETSMDTMTEGLE
jgi:hypothetical protein